MVDLLLSVIILEGLVPFSLAYCYNWFYDISQSIKTAPISRIQPLFYMLFTGNCMRLQDFYLLFYYTGALSCFGNDNQRVLQFPRISQPYRALLALFGPTAVLFIFTMIFHGSCGSYFCIFPPQHLFFRSVTSSTTDTTFKPQIQLFFIPRPSQLLFITLP